MPIMRHGPKQQADSGRRLMRSSVLFETITYYRVIRGGIL
jgi:hypothetical protein